MKFLVVDDHVLIRDALDGVLRDLQPDASVATAATGAEARAMLAAAPDTDLVLLDLQLPDSDGLELLADWRDEYPATAVVMLSATRDAATIRAAMAAGAAGFLSKAETRPVLIGALKLILAGGAYVPPSVLSEIGSSPSPGRPAASVAGGTGASGVPSPQSLDLTARQLDVLGLMMQGRSNKLIARELNLAEATVKNHVTALLRALQVDSRTEAVIAVTNWGWTVPRPSRPRP
jgi:DNA-binding NarL/FixJ family response regulator